MGFMVAVDRCTLVCFRSVLKTQLSVRFKESIWARNVITNQVPNFLVVMIFGCMIA